MPFALPSDPGLSWEAGQLQPMGGIYAFITSISQPNLGGSQVFIWLNPCAPKIDSTRGLELCSPDWKLISQFVLD